jgi:hypothetical protein
MIIVPSQSGKRKTKIEMYTTVKATELPRRRTASGSGEHREKCRDSLNTSAHTATVHELWYLKLHILSPLLSSSEPG